MSKYCAENERMKREYSFFLEAVNGKQSGTIDAALRAIERFEITTNRKPFRKFNVEQARSFRARLGEETGASGKPLSVATIASTLKHLRNFFLWLSREPGFRAALNANDANYFTPSEQDMRVAAARREKHVATLEEIKHVLALMPAETTIERRNRALIAFAILSWRARRRSGVVSLEARRHEGANRLSGRPRSAHESAKNLRFHVFPGRTGAGRHRRGLYRHAEGRTRLRPGRSAVSVDANRAGRGPGLCRRRLVSVALERRGADTADFPRGLRGGGTALRQSAFVSQNARAPRGFAQSHAGRGKGLFAEFRPRKRLDDARELRNLAGASAGENHAVA